MHKGPISVSQSLFWFPEGSVILSLFFVLQPVLLGSDQAPSGTLFGPIFAYIHLILVAQFQQRP